MTTEVLIEKADGTTEPFREEKLRESLLRSGADAKEADQVVDHIRAELVPDAKTSTIYKHAFAYLRHMRTGLAARYSLRRSLADLGPSGYPFELFVGELLRAEGYEAKTNMHLSGKCAKHEIDVIASGPGEFIMAEVKFHNQSQIKSDLKVALYVQARFEDLLETAFDGEMKEGQTPEGWLVTNTKFTSHAMRYGKCVKLHMLGWSKPGNNSLQNMIERNHLEPVTTLTTLKKHEKTELLRMGHVLCKSLHDNKSILEEVGVAGDRVEKVREEAHNVCLA